MPILAISQTHLMEISLYPDKTPNNTTSPNLEYTDTSNGVLHVGGVKEPTLTLFLPSSEKATGSAVLICPGGGYKILSMRDEGYKVAKRLNAEGVAAFVLKYRIPDVINQPDPSVAPLQDAQQALITIRKRAKEWNVSPEKVGIMGFSAGAHVASTAGTHFDKSFVSNPENISLRPDFMLLIYPVISSNQEISHRGSFENLLGKNPTKEQLHFFSNETQITEKTPPAFLVHSSDDKTVPVENSIRFYQALLRFHIPAEMHIYQSGGHGYGLHNLTTKDDWMKSCLNWMEENGFLK